MTQLRRQMLEELERRNYSASTVRCYSRTVENFAQYFKSRPDRLGPEQIRQYQAHLFRDRKLAPNRQYLRGLRRKPDRWLLPGGAWHAGTTRSRPVRSGTLAMTPPSGPASPSPPTPTFCVIALPHTCSKPGRTCAPSRCCSVIATWKRQLAICICRRGSSATLPALWTRSS